MNVTERISINGWRQVKAALVTAKSSFTGDFAKTLLIVNLSATPATVHCSDGGAQPATATDGIPIGSGATTTAIGNSLLLENVDLNSVWINTTVAQDIGFLVNGS